VDGGNECQGWPWRAKDGWEAVALAYDARLGVGWNGWHCAESANDRSQGRGASGMKRGHWNR